MDESKKIILEKRIEKTMKALEKNKMKPFYAENRQQALELVKELLQPGQTVACGGSVTLDECSCCAVGTIIFWTALRPD